jgi:CRISPR-associated endonuclease/helicase Cas3
MGLTDSCERLSNILDRSTLERMWFLASDNLIPMADDGGFLEERWRPELAKLPDFDHWESWVPSHVRRSLNAVEDLARNAVGTEQYALTCRFLRGLVLLSDHAGSADEAFRNLQIFISPAAMVSALSGSLSEDNFYEHQRKAREARGNVILIAPTGSGKTEAALLWASAQGHSRTGVPPLFYVLPYQASLNAMRERLGRILGDDSVVLQHSRALQALYRQLLNRGYSSEEAKHTAVRERGLSRLHVSPVRIMTPYQLLRGAYQLPGHPALWTDAATGMFVLDEIHAYETTRLGMILELFSHLVRELGARVFIMSATLPTILRHELEAAIGTTTHVKASSATYERFQRHRIRLIDGGLLDPSTLDRIVESARKGQSVLVVATTVGRAQQAWEALRQPEHLGQEATVKLLHGRFCGRDRFEKEQELRSAVATDRPYNQRKPVVLVATQVVEVSLDVDFDVLFSDPAPLEALLQRFGRVNRKGRLKNADVAVMTKIPPDSPVYAIALVEGALECLASFNGEMVDESKVQTWLDKIYSGKEGKEWKREVTKARQEFRRDVLDTLSVFDSSPELGRRFDELFDGSEVVPKILEAQYLEWLERDPLLASSLLVPITSRQIGWLNWQRRLTSTSDGVRVANAAYDAEIGLQLSRMAPDDV